jgi:hypothetical protein
MVVSAVTRILREWDAKSNTSEAPVVIEFALSEFATPDEATTTQMDEAVHQGRATHDLMISTPSALVVAEDSSAKVNPLINSIDSQAASWEALLEKVQLCVTIVDRIVEVLRSNDV